MAKPSLPSIVVEMGLFGLFLCPLNNGDWMAGRANTIYSLDITSDHYADPRLYIRRTAREAVTAAAQAARKEGDDAQLSTG